MDPPSALPCSCDFSLLGASSRVARNEDRWRVEEEKMGHPTIIHPIYIATFATTLLHSPSSSGDILRSFLGTYRLWCRWTKPGSGRTRGPLVHILNTSGYLSSSHRPRCRTGCIILLVTVTACQEVLPPGAILGWRPSPINWDRRLDTSRIRTITQGGTKTSDPLLELSILEES